jgi:NTE family protein
MLDEDDLKVGLALSGGGFRATLFHVGSLSRLNELGWLRKLDIITSVSGGSIIAGLLARNWSELTWTDGFHGEVATNFQDKVEKPIRDFCSRTIDVTAGLLGALSPFSSIPDEVASAYDEHLYQSCTLQQLPAPEPGRTPRFVFYATSLQSGSSVRISSKYLADYKVGRIDKPNFKLSKVVAASSAFPPVLSPVVFEFNDVAIWKNMEGAYLHDHADLKNRLILTDGGVYDNLGLEAIWDRCETVFVSDAGAPLGLEERPSTDPMGQMGRVRDILIEQTRALRKRKLVEDFRKRVRKGTYWGITTSIDEYGLTDSLTKDSNRTRQLKDIRTRLNKFSAEEQGVLINWGYALADSAVRAWVMQGIKVTGGVIPDPNWPV